MPLGEYDGRYILNKLFSYEMSIPGDNLICKENQGWYYMMVALDYERVWDKTHLIGGKLFKAAGIIAALGVFFPIYAIFLVLGPVILVAFFTITYSYFTYQKEMKA